jgi:UDP-N-acetylmuramoylalanine--D-glutamate ligase
MISLDGYKNRCIAVLGLGRSGLSVALALRAGGARVVVWDDTQATLERVTTRYPDMDVRDLNQQESWMGIESLILSPGIAHNYPKIGAVLEHAFAFGVPIDNDIGLFFSCKPPEVKTVLVTGSNGKSTTALLIYHLLSKNGRDVQIGGNIGRGVFDLAPSASGAIVVLEVSSYQTELASVLAPDIAVFTNFSPDHMERHGGKGGYFAAKKRLFDISYPSVAVVGVDEQEGAFLANSLKARSIYVVYVSCHDKKIPEPFMRYENENVQSSKGDIVSLAGLRNLAGRHNSQNACCACAVCCALGMTFEEIAEALPSFTGLPHRFEWLGEKNGVSFINDSKATNMEAARQALEACENIHWIAGGQSKEGGYLSNLGNALHRVVKAYFIGEAAREFSDAIGKDKRHVIADTLERAIALAVAEAKAGDTILFSPACASFDQFQDFEARGNAFRDIVSRICGF